MSVVTDDWFDDSMYEYDDEFGRPWPGSVEAKSWWYDNPMYEYEPEADDDYED